MHETLAGIHTRANGAPAQRDEPANVTPDSLDAERSKWQAYYESLPLEEEDEALKGFNREWVECVAEIVPHGGRVLEAGCGAGWQSLALARSGIFRVSLMDFTPAALGYARRLFEREHVSADFHEENVFTHGEPEYDLVFNAGVLEHYTFDQQVEFVRAMASRSRRYVAALVPNRQCYWYWLWRIHAAGAGAWPFGKEVPVTDLTRVFEAAGLRSVRRAFVGHTWTEAMIQRLDGIDPSLKNLILQVHRSLVVPSAQKCYLVAALGSLSAEEHAGRRSWTAPIAADSPETSEAIAALADALALRIAADGKLQHVQAQLDAQTAQLAAQTEAAEQAAEVARRREAETGELRAQLARLGETAAQTEAELRESARRAEAALREVQSERARAAVETEALRRRLAKIEADLAADRQKQEWYRSSLATERHARQVLEAAVSASYADTVARIRDVVRSAVPRDATVLVVSKGDEELLQLDGRPAWHFPQTEDGEYAGHYPADSDAAIAHLESLVDAGGQFLLFPNTAFWWLEHYQELREYLDSAHDRAWGDERCIIYKLQSQTALPARRRPGRAVRSSQAVEVKPAPANLYDIVCFPIIPWDFRFQRPQQLMSRFAAAGHRVFYLSLDFRTSGEPYVVRRIGDNIYEASLRGPRVNVYQGTLDDPSRNALVEALDALRRDCALDATAAVVQLPFWWPLANEARGKFDWPVVYDRMDHHAGFSTNHPLMVEQEHELLARADLVVAASAPLEAEARQHNRKVLLLRNACDFDHFAKVGSKPKAARPVIGYYGAIADWFDSDLVADLAERRPDWDFVLVGGTFTGDVSRLSRLANVTLTGEKPYAEVPDWLARFDVTILPFKRLPLTEATNPVKAYEIFAAGKPLVSVPLPEMAQFAPLVRLAADAASFEREIRVALEEADGELVRRRRAFAKEHTWQKRFEALAPAIRDLLPKDRPAGAPASSHREQLVAKLRSIASSGRLPIIYTTPVDWSIPLFQRPQQMALALAAQGWPTLYITPNHIDRLKGTATLADNCYLIAHQDLEVCFETLDRFALILLSTTPNNPTSETLRAIRDKALIVYDFIDELHEDIHAVSDAMRQSHEYLLRHSDLICATADSLYEQAFRVSRVPVMLCPNGADVRHFRLERKPTVPPDLQSIVARGKPVIGYFGALAKWFDYDVIRYIATSRSGYEIVLIGIDYDGSIGRSGVLTLPNVHFLGTKHYASLPDYAAYFDVATVPFVLNDVTQSTSPVKLFEYMAARRPIVTTDLRECRKYRSVLIGRDYAEFVAKLDEALGLRSDAEYRVLLDREADENSWAGRARALMARVEELAVTRNWPTPNAAPRPDGAVQVRALEVPGLVSVVLPVYNQASLLRESIRSVIAQTYPDFELIVVNDGSTDGVESVMDEFAGHPKVRLLTQDNQKLPKALSNGFEFACGEFWTWTSADNLMRPDQLARMVAFLRAHPDVDMVYADYLAIDDRGRPLRDPAFRPQNRRTPDNPEIHLPRTTSTLNTVLDNFIGACFMYRGRVGRVLGEYDPNLGIEDYDYWMRLNALFKIAHLGTDEILYDYRVHDNSLNARAAELKIYDRVHTLMEYERERHAFYVRPWTIFADAATLAWLRQVGAAPHAVVEWAGETPSGVAKAILLVHVDSLPSVASRLPPTGQGPYVAVWFPHDGDARAPYRFRQELRSIADVCFAADAATADRLDLFAPKVLFAEPGRGLLDLAMAAANNDLYYGSTRPAAERERQLPNVYQPAGRRLRVLFQADNFTLGGLENVVIDLAQSLNSQRFDPALLVLGRQGPAADRARAAGIPVWTLPEHDRETHYRRLLADRRIDLVNANFSLFGAAAAADAGVPFVQTIHNTYVWLSPEEVAAHRECDRHTSAYVCVSPNVALHSDVGLGLSPGKMIIVPNGIDTGRLRAPPDTVDRLRLRHEFGLGPDDFVFLNVATVHSPKAQRVAVQALAQVLPSFPRAKVVLLGEALDTNYLADVEREVRTWKLESSFVFVGHREDVTRFHRAADAFLLPSFVEGWSLALTEAVYAGLPFVATDVGGARDLLAQTGGGRLVRPPFDCITDVDAATFHAILHSDHPGFVRELAEAMRQTCADLKRPAVTEGVRDRLDRRTAYAVCARLFEWLAQGGAPAAARAWSRVPDEIHAHDHRTG
jgi:glycosyltransferase involved in cell wall biosynthesis